VRSVDNFRVNSTGYIGSSFYGYKQNNIHNKKRSCVFFCLCAVFMVWSGFVSGARQVPSSEAGGKRNRQERVAGAGQQGGAVPLPQGVLFLQVRQRQLAWPHRSIRAYTHTNVEFTFVLFSNSILSRRGRRPSSVPCIEFAGRWTCFVDNSWKLRWTSFADPLLLSYPPLPGAFRSWCGGAASTRCW